MIARLLAHLRQQWIGALALFLVLTGGTAYAANTVFSSDIVDNQVFSADVRNDTLSSGGLVAVDLRAGAVGTSEVLDDTATGGGLAAADLRSGSVGPAEAAGLTGADIANAAGGSDNVNADKLDGLDSTAFIGGQGRIVTIDTVDVAGDPQSTALFDLPGFVKVFGECSNPPNGGTTLVKTYSLGVDVVADNGEGNPFHSRLFPNQTAGESSWDTAPSGDWLTFSFEAAGKVATAFIFSYAFHNPVLNQDACQYQGQVIVRGA